MQVIGPSLYQISISYRTTKYINTEQISLNWGAYRWDRYSKIYFSFGRNITKGLSQDIDASGRCAAEAANVVVIICQVAAFHLNCKGSW